MIPFIFWIIAILLFVAIFVFVELKYLRHKFKWVLLLTLLLIVIITFMMSISGQDVNLKTGDGVKLAFKLYGAWIKQSFANMKVLTAHAIKLNWAGNSTG
ncbi:MAG: hypothetical protein WC533_03350 [Candidatus Pacearchaeota archaeon]